MVKAGVPKVYATSAVNMSIRQIKSFGINNPTWIPLGRNN